MVSLHSISNKGKKFCNIGPRLPETLGSRLPETIADVEMLENNRKSFFSCWSKQKLQEEMDKNEKNRYSAY